MAQVAPEPIATPEAAIEPPEQAAPIPAGPCGDECGGEFTGWALVILGAFTLAALAVWTVVTDRV